MATTPGRRTRPKAATQPTCCSVLRPERLRNHHRPQVTRGHRLRRRAVELLEVGLVDLVLALQQPPSAIKLLS